MSNSKNAAPRFSSIGSLVLALLVLALFTGGVQAQPLASADGVGFAATFSLPEILRAFFAEIWPGGNAKEAELEIATSQSELDSEIEVDPPHPLVRRSEGADPAARLRR